MSAQDVRVVNMSSTNGVGIGIMLWLIAMVMMGPCGPVKVDVASPLRTVCECRCAP